MDLSIELIYVSNHIELKFRDLQPLQGTFHLITVHLVIPNVEVQIFGL